MTTVHWQRLTGCTRSLARVWPRALRCRCDRCVLVEYFLSCASCGLLCGWEFGGGRAVPYYQVRYELTQCEHTSDEAAPREVQPARQEVHLPATSCLHELSTRYF